MVFYNFPVTSPPLVPHMPDDVILPALVAFVTHLHPLLSYNRSLPDCPNLDSQLPRPVLGKPSTPVPWSPTTTDKPQCRSKRRERKKIMFGKL